MTEQYPCLIEEDPCGLPVQGLFDPVEEIEQDGQRPSVAHAENLFHLEGREGGDFQSILFGVEERPHGAAGD